MADLLIPDQTIESLRKIQLRTMDALCTIERRGVDQGQNLRNAPYGVVSGQADIPCSISIGGGNGDPFASTYESSSDENALAPRVIKVEWYREVTQGDRIRSGGEAYEVHETNADKPRRTSLKIRAELVEKPRSA